MKQNPQESVPKTETGSVSGLDEIRRKLAAVQDEVRLRDEQRKVKLQEIIKEAADMAEGNIRLSRKSKGTQPFQKINEEWQEKISALRLKKVEIETESRKMKEEIKKLRSDLEQQAKRTETGKEEIATLIEKLNAADRESDEKLTIAYRETSNAYGKCTDDFNEAIRIQQSILAENEKDDQDPHGYAARTVIDTHRNAGEEVNLDEREVQQGVRSEVQSRGYRDQAQEKVIQSKESIGVVTSHFTEWNNNLTTWGTEIDRLLEEAENEITGENLSATINSHIETITIFDKARFFTGKKEEAAKQAKRDLIALKHKIQDELKKKTDSMIEVNRKVVDILRTISDVTPNDDLRLAIIHAESSNPTKHFFELANSKAEDPAVEKIKNDHAQNQKLYEDMRALMEKVHQNAKELNNRINSSVDNLQKKKQGLLETIDAWIG